MAWYDSGGNALAEDRTYMGDNGTRYSLDNYQPVSDQAPGATQAPGWLNGFTQWNQMDNQGGYNWNQTKTDLGSAMQKYGIGQDFNWMDALNASNGTGRQGFDLYSPQRFTQMYLQGLDKLKGTNAYGDWQAQPGNSAAEIAKLDAGFADAKGKADASAKMDWGSYLAPSLLAAPVAAGALLGAGGAAAGAGAAGETAGLASGGMSLAPSAFEGIGSALIPAGANTVPFGLTAVGGGAAVPAAGALGGALVGAGAAAAGGVGGGSGSNVVASGTGGGSGGQSMDWLDEILNSPGGDASQWTNTGTAASDADIAFANDINNAAGLETGPGALDAPGGVNSTIPQPTGWGIQDLMKLPTSALKSLAGALGLNSTGSTSDLARLIAGGLGAYGASQNANTLQNIYQQQSAMGAPYRNMLAQSYSDPAGFLANSPDIKASVDQGTNALARSLSARDGNPTGSGRAMQEMQNYATQSLYGQLGNARNSLANYGGLSSFNQAAPQTQMAAGSAQNDIYGQIGGALGSLGGNNLNDIIAQAMRKQYGLSGGLA